MTTKSHGEIHYLTEDLSNVWGIDIEGDGLPSNTVWCATVKNCGTGEEKRFRGDNLLRVWINETLAKGGKLVAHNGLGYDYPTLNRLLKTTIKVTDVFDTLVMSQVYSPSLSRPEGLSSKKGPHSLEAWGLRLKFEKGDFEDFSQYSPEMEGYCMNDTRLCVLIYKALRDRMTKIEFSELGLEIEHLSWSLIQKQKKNGFAFNREEAEKLYAKLRGIEHDIERRIHEYWPPRLEVIRRGAKALKQNGTPSHYYEIHRSQYIDVRIERDGSYSCYDYVYFNIGSSAQRIQTLLELGWKNTPDEVTKGGSPAPIKKGKLVPSMEKFVAESGKEEVRLIARWMEINARANMVNTWIEALNPETGRIHGTLWLASTFRYRHSGPNTANIPAVRLDSDDNPVLGQEGSFTYESRDLWTVRSPDRVLVGVDAKGIQLRNLAHYLNNDSFTEAILSEDPHAYNRDAWGFAPGKEGRSLAKTIVYAIVMGAGDARTASTAGISLKEAKDVKALFFDRVPEMPKLIKKLKAEWSRTGRITLCDGSKILVKQDYMVVPYLLQGDESRIMKKTTILTDKEIRKRKLDVLKVCEAHDEHQYDTFKDHLNEFERLLPSAFADAGKFFNYRIPIECDIKVGKTWSETH